MNEAIMENLSYLANLGLTYVSTLVIAEDSNILFTIAVALLLVLLAARMVKRKHGGFPKSFRAWRTVINRQSSSRLFESRRGPALKACPNCAEQLPLSAIICNTCDYNFLAARPDRGQKLLPHPNS
jgi:hypothetical protein